MAATRDQIDALLATSLADGLLSRAERQALDEAIGRASLAELSLWRASAFESARRALAGGRPDGALDWLEGVTKSIVQAAAPARPSAPTASTACFSPGVDCLETIIGRIDQTNRLADLCVFTITDDRITRAIESAHRRGVAFRIVTDNDKALDLGSDIEHLHQIGIPVRTDRTPAHMHHKFAIFDGKCLLNGSYNWTRGAAAENRENLVTTTDARLIGLFQAEFESLWTQLD